jgi:hypothetical protein
VLWECKNIFVNAGLPALANLIAGVTSGQFVTTMGFGSGVTPPAATDTGLTAVPTYYNAIGTHSFPSSGSVEFNYSLLTTDYGANGMTIQELGLFANSSGVALPAAQGTTNPAWSANTPKVVGNLVVDNNNDVQRCTTAGTTGGATPSWSGMLSGTTTDGTVTWTMIAFHQPTGPLIAHVSVPAFAYTGTGNFQERGP